MNIQNKRISQYEIKEEFEAGIVLTGAEIKCIRSRGMDISHSFVYLDNNGELWLTNSNIPMTTTVVGLSIYDPVRSRKLLLNKREINKIKGLVSIKGFTIVPKYCYLKGQKLKCLIAVVKGKKDHDKRQDIKDRETKLEVQRAMQTKQKRDF